MNPAMRKAYIAALGLEGWISRSPPAAIARSESPGADLAGADRGDAERGARSSAEPPALRARDPGPAQSRSRATSPVTSPEASREDGFDWDALRARVAACTLCPLAATRTQTVFGVGNPRAEWLIVGEAPGAEEDRRGEPFVGRAGQLLNAMLRAVGLSREEVYIANILKCRPPGNRDPAAGESAECLPYLERQIALLEPKIMLAVGRISAQNLLKTDAPLARLRGQVHRFGIAQVPLVVTYHPAYLLRTPTDKRKAWQDLKFAREVSARVQR
jgi:DNA polymerase